MPQLVCFSLPVTEEIQTYFVDVWTNAWASLEPILTIIGETIQVIATIVTEAVNIVAALIDGDWTAAWESAKAIILAFVDYFLCLLGTSREEIIAIWNYISQSVTETVRGFVDGVTEFFNKLSGNIEAAVSAVLTVIAQWGKNVINWVTTEVPAVINNIVKFFAELPEKLWTEFLNALESFKQFTLDMMTAVQTEIPKIADEIYRFFSELPEKMRKIGADIVQGLINGISSMAEVAGEEVGKFVDGVKAYFTGESGFNEHSPSKWAAQVGSYVVEGLAGGIADNAGIAAQTAQKMLDSIKNVIESSADSMKDIMLVAFDTILSHTEISKLANDALKIIGIDLEMQQKAQDESISLKDGYYIARLEMQRKFQNDSISLKSNFYKEAHRITLAHYDEMNKARRSQSEMEYAEMSIASMNLVSMMRSYAPWWYDIGITLMNNLISGLQAYMGELQGVVSRIQSMLNSITVDSMTIPVYGSGGIVTSPHMAVVGDVPEAIIPLNQLYDVLMPKVTMLSDIPSNNYYREQSTPTQNFNYTININQPVKSPAETARAIKRISKELARSY